jgi:hypothetical protein
MSSRKACGTCQLNERIAEFRRRHPGVSAEEARRVCVVYGDEASAGRKRRTAKLTIGLPATALADLRREARRRGVTVGDFSAAIMRAIIADDLYAAVVDR